MTREQLLARHETLLVLARAYKVMGLPEVAETFGALAGVHWLLANRDQVTEMGEAFSAEIRAVMADQAGA